MIQGIHGATQGGPAVVYPWRNDPDNRQWHDSGMTKTIDKRRTVDFQGALDVISIESIFQLLYYTNVSGKLLLLNPPAKATFFFKGGSLVWGTLHAQQKQLGQRLLEANLITREQLSECLSVHDQHNRQIRLGSIMQERGLVSEEDLQELLKAQIKDAFFHVLSWNQGTFAFVSNSSVEDEIALNERIDHLLLEGIVSIDQKSDKTFFQ